LAGGVSPLTRLSNLSSPVTDVRMRIFEVIELLILIVTLEESEYFHLIDSRLPDESRNKIRLPQSRPHTAKYGIRHIGLYYGCVRFYAASEGMRESSMFALWPDANLKHGLIAA